LHAGAHVSTKPADFLTRQRPPEAPGPADDEVDVMKKWQCVVCGLIYDESQGWPDDDIAPGTRWEDVPADWLCPDCGVGKGDFEMIEIG
jgi:rubredoxin